MAKITVSDLRSDGSDLFADSESFMEEMTEREMTDILGGGWIRECIKWVKSAW